MGDGRQILSIIKNMKILVPYPFEKVDEKFFSKKKNNFRVSYQYFNYIIINLFKDNFIKDLSRLLCI